MRDGIATIPASLCQSSGTQIIISSLGDARAEYTIQLERMISTTAIPAPRRLDLIAAISPAEITSPAGLAQASTQTETVDSTASVTPSDQPVGTSSPKTAAFDLPTRITADADPAAYVRIQAVTACQNRHARVMLDREMADQLPLQTAAQKIARYIDQQLIPRLPVEWGRCPDLDGDGRVTVLITPHVQRLNGGSEPLAGFTRPSDLDPGLAPPFSNACDLIYLSSDLPHDEKLEAVLCHEYMHLLCIGWAAKTTAMPVALQEEWLSEGIAHLGELHLSRSDGNVAHRLLAFGAHPDQSPLAVISSLAAGQYRQPGSRGATCSFLSYCQQRTGLEFVQQLATATEPAREALQRVTGSPFEQLYRDWTVTLAMRQPVQTRGVATPAATLAVDWRPALQWKKLAWGEASPALASFRQRGTASSYWRTETAPSDVSDPLSALRSPGDVWRGALQISTSSAARLQVTVIE